MNLDTAQLILDVLGGVALLAVGLIAIFGGVNTDTVVRSTALISLCTYCNCNRIIIELRKQKLSG